MPPKQPKRKTAPLTTRRQTKRRTTQQIGHAVEAAEPSSQPSGSAESQLVVPAVHNGPSRVTSLTRLWPALPKKSPASLLPYSILLLSHPLIMAHWNNQYPSLTSRTLFPHHPYPLWLMTILQLWLQFNRYP